MKEDIVQLLRVLLLKANGDLQIEVRHGAGQKLEHYAKNWGIVLADSLRQISYAYQRTEGTDVELIRAKILDYMKEDLETPDPAHLTAKMKRFDPPGG